MIINSINSSVINTLEFDEGVNVKQYGAIGNATTDDLAAINSAITALAGSGDLHFPKRTYLISDDLTIASGIRLVFEAGAKIKIADTKTLTINGTIDAGLYQVFEYGGATSAVVFGAGSVKEVYPQWWGATGDGTTDDTTACQRALTAYRNVHFPYGTYRMNCSAPGGSVAIGAWKISGDGMQNTILKAAVTTSPVLMNTYFAGWDRCVIEDLELYGGGTREGVGFSFGNPAAYTTDAEYTGRTTFSRVSFRNFDKALYKPYGNIGNRVHDCNFASNNYGIYGKSYDASAMHTGADAYYDTHFASHYKAAIIILDSATGPGGWHIQNCLFEGNVGHSILLDASIDSTFYTPFTMEGCWFEEAAPSGTIVTDGLGGVDTLSATRKDLWFRNAKACVLREYNIGCIKFESSNVKFVNAGTQCARGATFYNYDVDSTSTVIYDPWYNSLPFGGPEHTIVAHPPYGGRIWAQPAPQMNMMPAHLGTYHPSALYAFSGRERRQLGGPYTIYGTVINGDGLTFNKCNELVIPASASQWASGPFVTTLGKFYAYSAQVRRASGTGNIRMLITGDFDATGAVTINHSDWRQYGGVFKDLTGGTERFFFYADVANAATLRLGAFQLVEFDTQQDAYNYLNQGRTDLKGDTYLYEAVGTKGKVTIADDGTDVLAVANVVGMIVITDSDDNIGIFQINGSNNTVTELHDIGNVYSITVGTATSTNIYWSAGNSWYEIENKRTAEKSYKWLLLGTDFAF